MTVIEKKFVAPALPTYPPDYDQRQGDQLNYALRLYFNLLDNYLSQLATLLNNGGPFDSLTADEFIGGTFNGGGINGSYIGAYGVGASAMLASGMINKSFVGTQVMAQNFYGDKFYGDRTFLLAPYNELVSTVDQTAAAIDQSYPITYTATNFPDGITVTSNSRITFSRQGIYSINYSLQLQSLSVGQETVSVWLRYKGTDIPNSNTAFGIAPRKSAGVPSEVVAVTSIMVDILADGDYVELIWHTTSTSVSMQYLPAVTASPGVTPAIPATPSAIVAVMHISAQFPPTQRVAPAPVFGFGEIGNVIVSTNRT